METRPEQIEDGDYVELLDIGERDAFRNDKKRYCNRVYQAFDVRPNWWNKSNEFYPCRLKPHNSRETIPFAEAKLLKLDMLEAFARLAKEHS